MQRPISDWAGNIAAFALVIAMNVLSNALPNPLQTQLGPLVWEALVGGD